MPHARRQAHAHAYPDAAPIPTHPHPDADAHSDADAYSDAHPDTDTDAHSDADPACGPGHTGAGAKDRHCGGRHLRRDLAAWDVSSTGGARPVLPRDLRDRMLLHRIMS